MPTMNSPLSFGQTQATEGYDRIILEQELLETMQDGLDLTSTLGLARLMGDVRNTGTDTLQINQIDGVGYGATMTAIAEGDAVAPTPFATGYSDVTIGDYAFAQEETYKQQGLGRPNGSSLDLLIRKIPDTLRATMRRVMCVTGATITTAVGSGSAAADLDALLAFIAAWALEPGAGRPTLVLHPQQLQEIRESIRTEPSFESGGVADFANAQGLAVGANGMIQQVFQNFSGLGVDIATTNDVQVATGVYQGFGYAMGGMGWARMGTAGLKTANPQATLYAPDYGLIIEELTDGGRQTIRTARATAWFGFALGHADVFMQRRLISQV